MAYYVNRLHPLNRDLILWYMNLPATRGRGLGVNDPSKSALINLEYDKKHAFNEYGAVQAAGPKGRPGGYGSWYFDGSSAFSIQHGDQLRHSTGRGDIDASSYTISCWVKPTATNANQMTYGAGVVNTGGKNYGWGQRLNSDGTILNWRQVGTSTDYSFDSAVSYTTDWQFIACTYDKITGNLATVRNLTWEEHTSTVSTADAVVTGTNHDGDAFGVQDIETSQINFLTGWMDDIRISLRCMREHELAQLYRESMQGHRNTLNWGFPRKFFSLPAAAAAGSNNVSRLILGG